MTTERIRAALRLIYPDDITPMGKRVLEKVLDDMDHNEAPVSAGAFVCPKEARCDPN